MSGAYFDGSVGLGKLLSEEQFEVPDHQRDYSWERDETEQLIDDLEQARLDGVKGYFLGLMVFVRGRRGGMVVLDGQQRLATTVILLCAIRSWLRQYGFTNDADKILHRYIGYSELGEQDVRPRLVLNRTNNEKFVTYIVNERPAGDTVAALDKLNRYDPNRRLLEASLACRTRVARLADQPTPEAGARRLYDLVRYIHDAARIVMLVVSDEADAYRVFETLNNRGMELSALDLVKNHLFGKADDPDVPHRLRDIKARWVQMMNTLAAVKGDNFLRAYWTSRHGRTRITEVFPAVKESCKTSLESFNMATDMLEVSEQYAGLENADDTIWSGYSNDAKERIRALKQLGASPAHPMLLSALARFPIPEMERLLRLLEVLLVRYQLIGGGQTGQLETVCAKVAQEIYDRKLKTATEVAFALREIMPNDAEFRSAFTVKHERNNQKAKYILRKLDQEMRRQHHGPMWDAQVGADTLTLEHILPRNPGAEWQDVLANDANVVDDCVYLLGNLCLLTKVNRDLGRRGYAEKAAVFAATPLPVTEDAANHDTWDRRQIYARQVRLAKYAVEAWRFQ